VCHEGEFFEHSSTGRTSDFDSENRGSIPCAQVKRRFMKVLEFTGITTLPIAVDKVLNAAKEAKLESVFVIGRDPDGNFYTAASEADGGHNLILLEFAKRNLLISLDKTET
jgi:hypothetical protein